MYEQSTADKLDEGDGEADMDEGQDEDDEEEEEEDEESDDVSTLLRLSRSFRNSY